MSKDRVKARDFAAHFLNKYRDLVDEGEGFLGVLTKMIDKRDRETRNMACSDLISAAEDLIVAPVAAESTETNDQGDGWGEGSNFC